MMLLAAVASLWLHPWVLTVEGAGNPLYGGRFVVVETQNRPQCRSMLRTVKGRGDRKEREAFSAVLDQTAHVGRMLSATCRAASWSGPLPPKPEFDAIQLKNGNVPR
jgi:hypothetical protein